MNPTKRMSYTQFIKLPVQQRKMHSQYFIKNHPKSIPTIIKNQSPDLPQLKNCKYLITGDVQMFGQLAAMRAHIIKNSQSKISKQDQLFFYSNSKIINSTTKGVQLYQSVKNTLQDGWLVITYTKEATFGGN